MKESVKIFLESGLLESYLLGMTNAVETLEVEKYLREFPEVQAEYELLQNTIEKWAGKQFVAPPKGLKSDILTEINKLEPTPVKSITSKPVRNKWAIAAALTALILSMTTLYFWSEKSSLQSANAQLENSLEDREQALLEQQESCRILEEQFHLLNDPNTKKFILNGNNKAPGFRAVAFWNEKTQQSYLNVASLPTLPKKQCFQLWADVEGKMVNVGVIKGEENKLVSIPFKINAESLNITIEPEGGSDHPTVSNLVSSIVI